MYEVMIDILKMPYDVSRKSNSLTRHQHDDNRVKATEQIEILSDKEEKLEKSIIDYSKKEINQELCMNLRFLDSTKHVYEEGTCILLTLDQLGYLIKCSQKHSS